MTATEVETEVEIEAPLSFANTLLTKKKDINGAKEINAMFPKEKSPTQKVLEVVLSSDKPLSGEDIAEKSGVNKYRVYKILSYLTKRKKIQRVTFSLYRKKQRT